MVTPSKVARVPNLRSTSVPLSTMVDGFEGSETRVNVPAPSASRPVPLFLNRQRPTLERGAGSGLKVQADLVVLDDKLTTSHRARVMMKAALLARMPMPLLVALIVESVNTGKFHRRTGRCPPVAVNGQGAALSMTKRRESSDCHWVGQRGQRPVVVQLHVCAHGFPTWMHRWRSAIARVVGDGDGASEDGACACKHINPHHIALDGAYRSGRRSSRPLTTMPYGHCAARSSAAPQRLRHASRESLRQDHVGR